MMTSIIQASKRQFLECVHAATKKRFGASKCSCWLALVTILASLLSPPLGLRYVRCHVCLSFLIIVHSLLPLFKLLLLSDHESILELLFDFISLIINHPFILLSLLKKLIVSVLHCLLHIPVHVIVQII